MYVQIPIGTDSVGLPEDGVMFDLCPVMDVDE